MDVQITSYRTQSVSLAHYAKDLARSGIRVFPGAPGTFWTRHESGAMMRRPTFYTGHPAPREVQQILWSTSAAVASYLLEPDEHHLANAWLYVCTDPDYALDKLAPAMRRNVRRGLKELAIAPLNSEQLLAHGSQAFCDTRRRAGLSDGTPEEFRRFLTAHARLPEMVFLGAWKENQLAAFLTITEVEDWAEIGCFSMDALLQYRPNETLIYSALFHYLVEQKCRVVSYGLSSIQAESNAAGLHKFKLKVGFEARPAHRAFVPHPLLRPFVNRLTLWGIKRVLQLKPQDRRFKKAGGAVALMLGDISTAKIGGSSKSDE
jgi:hypothetical protein